MLVFLIIFSFATDFTCLSAANTDSFQGRNIIVNDEGLSESLFKYFYFSIVTFASVGYGDIVPITIFSRLLVILEIIQSFVLIVFGLSNINHIHTTVKTSIAK
jgi:voltage-gated potassium channel Kch